MAQILIKAELEGLEPGRPRATWELGHSPDYDNSREHVLELSVYASKGIEAVLDGIDARLPAHNTDLGKEWKPKTKGRLYGKGHITLSVIGDRFESEGRFPFWFFYGHAKVAHGEQKVTIFEIAQKIYAPIRANLKNMGRPYEVVRPVTRWREA